MTHRWIWVWLMVARRLFRSLLLGHKGPAQLRRWIARLFAFTLRLIPVDPHLLTNHKARSKHLNRQLAWSLAFVAGAVNAGGFLAVELYTSHVTGAVAKISDQLVLGNTVLALEGVGIVASFGLGAFFSTLLISYGRRHRVTSHYSASLLIEAILMALISS